MPINITTWSNRLRDAAYFGDPLQVQKNIDKGADINYVKKYTGHNHLQYKEGMTPVFLAAYGGNIDCLNLLIEAGADVNVGGYGMGYATLTLMVRTKKTDIVKILIEAGAEVNATKEHDCETALHAAARCNRLEHVRVLLDAGADKSILSKEGKKPIDLTDDPDIIKLLS